MGRPGPRPRAVAVRGGETQSSRPSGWPRSSATPWATSGTPWLSRGSLCPEECGRHCALGAWGLHVPDGMLDGPSRRAGSGGDTPPGHLPFPGLFLQPPAPRQLVNSSQPSRQATQLFLVGRERAELGLGVHQSESQGVTVGGAGGELTARVIVPSSLQDPGTRVLLSEGMAPLPPLSNRAAGPPTPSLALVYSCVGCRGRGLGVLVCGGAAGRGPVASQVSGCEEAGSGVLPQTEEVHAQF